MKWAQLSAEIYISRAPCNEAPKSEPASQIDAGVDGPRPPMERAKLEPMHLLDFHSAVAELRAEGPTLFQQAIAACPWYDAELRFDLLCDVMDAAKQTEELRPHAYRIACIGNRILEAALATGSVAETQVMEIARAAGTLASKLTENYYIPPKKYTDELKHELLLLEALGWQLPRASPFYILRVLCSEVVAPPENLQSNADRILGLFVCSGVYCRLKQPAVAAAVVLRFTLTDLNYDIPLYNSLYKVPDVYREAPLVLRELRCMLGEPSPIVA